METAVNVADTPAANEAVIANEITNNEPAAPSMDEELRSIWDKAHPHRDDSGKFASKNPAEPPPETGTDNAVQNADPTAEKAIEQAPPAIDAPISWSAEQKAAAR